MVYVNLIPDTVDPDSFSYKRTPDPEILQYVEVTLYPNSDCANQSLSDYPPPPSQLCAGFIENTTSDVGGSCHGDR